MEKQSVSSFRKRIRFSSDSINKYLCGRYVVAYNTVSMVDHCAHKLSISKFIL